MGLPDFPFPEAFSPNQNASSYLHHSEVLKFLHSYADHFQLRDYIKVPEIFSYIYNRRPNFPLSVWFYLDLFVHFNFQFHRRVIDIRPILSEAGEQHLKNSSTPRWRVTVEHMRRDGFEDEAVFVEEFEFDAVIICNG